MINIKFKNIFRLFILILVLLVFFNYDRDRIGLVATNRIDNYKIEIFEPNKYFSCGLNQSSAYWISDTNGKSKFIGRCNEDEQYDIILYKEKIIEKKYHIGVLPLDNKYSKLYTDSVIINCANF